MICELLGEFAQGSRYFNLDAVLGRKQRYNSERAWESLETTLMKASLGEVEYYKKLGNPKMLDELYSLSNRGIVIYLEKYLRAITRQFIFQTFSNDASSMIVAVDYFGYLRNSELGITNYTEFRKF